MFTLAGYKAWPDGKQAAVGEQLSDGCTQTERKKLFQSVVYKEMCQNFCDESQLI